MDTTAGRADAVTQRRVQFRSTTTHITYRSAFSSLMKSAFTAFASNSGNGSRIQNPESIDCAKKGPFIHSHLFHFRFDFLGENSTFHSEKR